MGVLKRVSILVPVLVSVSAAFACAADQETATAKADKNASEPASADAGAAGGLVGMKLIPAGKAVIGMNADEIKNSRHKENPQYLNILAGAQPRHEEQVEAFYLDVRETTHRQWKHYLDATEQKASPDLVKYWADGWMSILNAKDPKSVATDPQANAAAAMKLAEEGKIPEGMEDAPVVMVSYDDIQGYCRWARRRLPTEVEYEFAARGPTGTMYPWGNEFDTKDKKGGELAISDTTKFPRGSRGPQPVGSRDAGASAFGIHDLSGNVWEWTSSRYEAYKDYKDLVLQTKRGKEGERFVAPFNKLEFVLRGGSFNLGSTGLLSALRQPVPAQTWMNDVGFRTAKSVQPGVDSIRNQLSLLASYNASNDPLDLKSTVAIEREYAGEHGLLVGSRTFAFAPVAKLPKLREMNEPATSVTLGVLVVSEPVVNPAIPPGAYTVKFHSKNPKEKALYPPDDLWVYHGSHHLKRAADQAAADAKAAAKKAAADAKKAAKEKAKGGKGGKEEKEEEEPAEAEEPAAEEEATAPTPVLELPEGSIQFDKTRDHVVLWSYRGTAVAALPVKDDLKDTAKPEKPSLKTEKVLADVVRKIPALDRITLRFAPETEMKGKAVAFELPLSIEQGKLDSNEPPAMPKPKAEAAPADAKSAEAAKK
ncbi:MAG: formylglycine-generating enzyme family protein [Planctomycetes bacterium]|nr:formylglycine-generating enzyme family protein [Planctomycetota bacterium]